MIGRLMGVDPRCTAAALLGAHALVHRRLVTEYINSKPLYSHTEIDLLACIPTFLFFPGPYVPLA